MPSTPPHERIKSARDARGWTQEKLAFFAGVTVKTVWSAEHPERSVGNTSLTKIGTALGIPFEELRQEEVAS